MGKTNIQLIKKAASLLINSKLQNISSDETLAVLVELKKSIGLESIEEALLFVGFFDFSCRDSTASLEDLADFFKCSSLDISEYIPALKSLESKGYLKCIRTIRNKSNNNYFYQSFEVLSSITGSILENRPIEIDTTSYNNDLEDNRYSFCAIIKKLVEDEEIESPELFNSVKNLENTYSHIDYIKKVKDLLANLQDRIFFYDICADHIDSDGESSCLSSTLKDIFSETGLRVKFKVSLCDGSNDLLKEKLVSIDDENISLSSKGKELFFENDICAFVDDDICKDIYDFVGTFSDIVSDSRYGRRRQKDDSWFNMLDLETKNKHIDVVCKLMNIVPCDKERFLFYLVVDSAISRTGLYYNRVIDKIYTSPRSKINALNEIKEEKHILQKAGYVELDKESSLFGDQSTLKLTDKGKEFAFGEDAKLFLESVSSKDLLTVDKIASKKLFFSPELDNQLGLIRKSLYEDNYQGLCARLKSNNLPQGIAVLLYGEPGTGKTESVMQIAKETGRDIFRVDISATKSYWFGESEKIIKKVFLNYKGICEESRIKPILLFNEADAVFSKRKNVESGNVAQTENAIQNIILEEMENLDGILIATTNLANNLDGAFERRFLFKVRFDNPTIEAKKSIWKDKLPLLSDSDTEILASSFAFSGGQIDNIVRKAMMQEIIYGEKPTLNTLTKLCSEEKIQKRRENKVGFM